MKLFLSGGGADQESEQIDREFIEALDTAKPVLYIPIAIDTDKYPYPSCLDWIKNNFQPFGFTNFMMWTEKDLKGKTLADFTQFGGIYIGGGNTFKLLKELREFGTMEILKSLALADIPIYGGSAGAIIMAKTIIPALSADENLVGLSDFSALNLLSENEVWCHYRATDDETIKEFISKYQLGKIICLPEDTGVVVSEKEIKAVGSGNICVFGKDTKITLELGSRFPQNH